MTESATRKASEEEESGASACLTYGRATVMWSVFLVSFVAYTIGVYYAVGAIDFSDKR